MGPLKGIKIVEVGGIGPGPFCAQMLTDMGANVVRVDREAQTSRGMDAKYAVLYRGRPSIGVDITKPEGVEALLRIIDQCDALIEGFRPGVMERLGLGPDVCLKRNPKLVFGRMSGWGQDGPLADITIDIDTLASEYRKAMGWDKESGHPAEATLERLGLKEQTEKYWE